MTADQFFQNNAKNKQHDEKRVVHLGTRPIWEGEQPFGLTTADRRQHLYVVGKTGTGKSTLIKNVILQDIEAGAGVGLIDPHGDLATEILEYIPPRRVHEVVYFNPSDFSHPVCFNLLASVPKNQRHRVASGIVGAFKNIWRDSWGPRLEYILYATIAALLECRNVSLLSVQRMLIDANYRFWVVEQVQDVILRRFWIEEFERYDKRMLAEFIAPIQNKIGQFLLASPIRNIVGQVHNRIEPRYMMDHNKIFIANLSKGLLGEDKANLLGALLVSQFELAAMGRASIAESDRKDFFLFIDEFQNFATDSFASILAEARKYRLNLTLSHQYLGQLTPEVQAAVFGNAGSLLSFRVGNTDGDQLEREFGNIYSAAHLGSLPNFEVCTKLLEGGEQKDAFIGRTFSRNIRRYGLGERISLECRKRHTLPCARVEERIAKWLER